MRSVLIAIVVVLVPAPALAFHEVVSFDRTANSGGGAGYYYTGSPRSKGYDCNICHLDAAHRIAIELDTELTDGRYEPGNSYLIRVHLQGEHKGLDSAFNPNTFTAEFIGIDGKPRGRVSALARDIVHVVDGGTVAIAEGMGNGELDWFFFWVAPDAAEPVTLYMAMLDGDGASDPVVRWIDPVNDDVATLQLRLCPRGLTCTPPPPAGEDKAAVACSGGGGSAATLLLVLLAAAALRVCSRVYTWSRARRRNCA